jgi:hypothetical protein
MIGRRSHGAARAFDEAWRGGTPRDEHIAELVRVAEDLCEAAVVEPSPAFRGSLRTQLMAEAATVLIPLPPPARRPVVASARSGPARRRLASITAVLIATGGAVGIVTSSASAVPGDMLYPVKRSVETVELQLHRDDASRGSFQLTQASERLAEARRLSADGRSVELIAETLDDFSTSATDGSTKLFSDFTSTGQEKSIRTVNDFAASSSASLFQLSRQLPADAADSFASAADAITDLVTEASSLCDDCAPADIGSLAASHPEVDAPKAAPKASAGGRTEPSDRPTKRAADPAKDAPAAPSRPTVAPTTGSTPTPAAPTTTAPSLKDLTDPLVGGLLGNDEQPGLVPGLLNGLLGTGQK